MSKRPDEKSELAYVVGYPYVEHLVALALVGCHYVELVRRGRVLVEVLQVHEGVEDMYHVLAKPVVVD